MVPGRRGQSGALWFAEPEPFRSCAWPVGARAVPGGARHAGGLSVLNLNPCASGETLVLLMKGMALSKYGRHLMTAKTSAKIFFSMMV